MNSYDINERFERVIEGLKYAGEIKSQVELARLMEVSSSTISKIVKKRQGLLLSSYRNSVCYFVK
jgi:DNA-binding Lrp family transcriptional regulator